MFGGFIGLSAGAVDSKNGTVAALLVAAKVAVGAAITSPFLVLPSTLALKVTSMRRAAGKLPKLQVRVRCSVTPLLTTGSLYDTLTQSVPGGDWSWFHTATARPAGAVGLTGKVMVMAALLVVPDASVLNA